MNLLLCSLISRILSSFDCIFVISSFLQYLLYFAKEQISWRSHLSACCFFMTEQMYSGYSELMNSIEYNPTLSFKLVFNRIGPIPSIRFRIGFEYKALSSSSQIFLRTLATLLTTLPCIVLYSAIIKLCFDAAIINFTRLSFRMAIFT